MLNLNKVPLTPEEIHKLQQWLSDPAAQIFRDILNAQKLRRLVETLEEMPVLESVDIKHSQVMPCFRAAYYYNDLLAAMEMLESGKTPDGTNTDLYYKATISN